MEISNRHIVVTGAAGGIGRALVRRFAAECAGALLARRSADGGPPAALSVATS
jgi:NAD(P)-dependent dehydrogenase (short-subunit alcohol dehydrogenase family)